MPGVLAAARHQGVETNGAVGATEEWRRGSGEVGVPKAVGTRCQRFPNPLRGTFDEPVRGVRECHEGRIVHGLEAMEHLVGERLVEVGGVLLVVVGRVEVDHATRGGTATALPVAVLCLRIGPHVLAPDLYVRRIAHDAGGEEQRVTDSSRYLAAVVLRLSQ